MTIDSTGRRSTAWPDPDDATLAAFVRRPAAVGIFDTDARFVWASPRALELLGTDPAHTRGRRLSEVSDSIDASWREQWLRCVPNGGSTVITVARLLDDAPWTLRAEVLVDAGGVRYVGVEAVAVEAVDRPDRAQAVLDLATDTAQVGTWDWDRDMGVIRWNDWHARLLGYEPLTHPWTYDDFVRRVHPGDREAVERAVQDAIASGELYEHVFRVELPDGRIRHMRGQGRSVPDEPYRMVGVLFDVTAPMEAAERERHLLAVLNDAEARARANLAAEIHDGPLQHLFVASVAVDAVARALERSDPARAVERTGSARRSLEVAQRELRALLAVLNTPLDGEPVDLTRALGELVRDIFRGRREDVTTAITITDPLPSELGRTVLQIAAEALLNVRKHAQADRVALTAAATDGGVLIRIEDDGVGYDANTAPSPGHYGRLVMRHRAEAASGRLVIDSNPGAGTCVVAELPYPIGSGRDGSANR